MRKKMNFVVMLVVTMFVPALAFCEGILGEEPEAATYWIAFAGSAKGGPKYVMKIDASGNVLKSPKQVVPASDFGVARTSTAIAKYQKDRLLLWFPGKKGAIYVAEIGLPKLNSLSLTKTTLRTTDTGSLQVTHKGQNNFLVMETGDNVLTAFGVNLEGIPNGTNWPVSPTTSGGNSLGGVSSDGQVAYSTDTRTSPIKLYVQPLNFLSNPIGDAKVVASIYNNGVSYIGPTDISGELAGGQRFVAYIWAPDDWGGSVPNHFRLQVISASGDKIESTRTLRGDAVEAISSFALDPMGGLVIYSRGGALLYQALNASGEKSGTPRVLVDGKLYDTLSGIDLVRN